MFGLMKSAKSSKKRVAVHVSRSGLTIVVVDASSSVIRIREHRVDTNLSELTDGSLKAVVEKLKSLVHAEGLQDASANVSLSGDYCVTRTIVGTNAHVSHELDAVAQRSHQYLSLGPGEKALARSLRSIDARHSQGWLTAANQFVLDQVITAMRKGGLRVEHCEHSLVGRCRIAGRLGLDADGPVLLVETNQSGVDVAISHKGRMLLGYRPGGIGAQLMIPEIISKHIRRIQRYCLRYFAFQNEKLTHIYVNSSVAGIEGTSERFRETAELEPSPITSTMVVRLFGDVDCANLEDDALSALGSLVAKKTDDVPNLMSANDGVSAPLSPILIAKAAWPVLASLAITAVIAAFAFHENNRVSDATTRAHALREVSRKWIELSAKERRLQDFESEAIRIRDQAIAANWGELLTEISNCLPDGAWLDSLDANGSGEVTIRGNCLNEEGIYAFAGRLKETTRLSQVALESASPSQSSLGSTTSFLIRAEFLGSRDPAVHKD